MTGWFEVVLAACLAVPEVPKDKCRYCLCPELEDYPCHNCPDPPPVCATCHSALAGACETKP